MKKDLECEVIARCVAAMKLSTIKGVSKGNRFRKTLDSLERKRVLLYLAQRFGIQL